MAPQESDALLRHRERHKEQHRHLSLNDDDTDDDDKDGHDNPFHPGSCRRKASVAVVLLVVVGVVMVVVLFRSSRHSSSSSFRGTGNETRTYRLVEVHRGRSFLDYYDFFQGPDSLGSAGHNVYVGRQRAQALNLVEHPQEDDQDDDDDDVSVVLTSAPGDRDDPPGKQLRESIRLEGRRQFSHGLIVLDVEHMPTGCGVWPAFWTTDEANWPDHGEIDIVEGINTQDVVKTALHTSPSCDMYAHVPRWAWSGQWDTATALPDTFTGQPNYDNRVEADNCWVMAPHQWANQGCVAASTQNGTLGTAINDHGGGIYVLEWDPDQGYIRSWVFPKKDGDAIPQNLLESLHSANHNQIENRVVPDPSTWKVLPYAYFAIGERSGCSADHFQNHHLVLNLAFCGTVAGNRFANDCPSLYQQYNVQNDSVLTCNAYVEANPEDALSEAYWKIRGVYLYQRGED